VLERIEQHDLFTSESTHPGGWHRMDDMLEVCTELTGSSPVVERLRQDIEAAARSDAKVLITGETGTGKEVVARLVHARSARRPRAFVPVNCAGIPETLLESSLFGHVRGSFTDAVRDRVGLLEAAHHGTAFLDEIGEMSPRMQGLLLRFLETGEIQRIGSDRLDARVDVRIIAATHRDLHERTQTNEFRLDLFYRLNVVHLRTPPLRECRGDIPALLNRFLNEYAAKYRTPAVTITPQAMTALIDHNWPGNVRELRNVAERIAVTFRGAVGAEQLPLDVSVPSRPLIAPGRPKSDELYERLTIGRESFWPVVYDPFVAHDLTREEVRAVIRRGLTDTRGNYRLLVRLFNMHERDYKRFLSFLRKHGCHIAFQQHRRVPVPSLHEVA
jgi:DNA-binding NtrC family response regulator